jgi:hypothetical protein
MLLKIVGGICSFAFVVIAFYGAVALFIIGMFGGFKVPGNDDDVDGRHSLDGFGGSQ